MSAGRFTAPEAAESGEGRRPPPSADKNLHFPLQRAGGKVGLPGVVRAERRQDEHWFLFVKINSFSVNSRGRKLKLEVQLEMSGSEF